MRLLEIGMRSSSGGVRKVVKVMKEGQRTEVCNPEMGHLKYLYLKNKSQIKLHQGINEVLVACSRQSNPPSSCCKDGVQSQMPP